MSREHHKFFEKFFHPENWKIMGAATGAYDVLHYKPIIGKIKKI